MNWNDNHSKFLSLGIRFCSLYIKEGKFLILIMYVGTLTLLPHSPLIRCTPTPTTKLPNTPPPLYPKVKLISSSKLETEFEFGH